MLSHWNHSALCSIAVVADHWHLDMSTKFQRLWSKCSLIPIFATLSLLLFVSRSYAQTSAAIPNSEILDITEAEVSNQPSEPTEKDNANQNTQRRSELPTIYSHRPLSKLEFSFRGQSIGSYHVYSANDCIVIHYWSLTKLLSCSNLELPRLEGKVMNFSFAHLSHLLHNESTIGTWIIALVRYHIFNAIARAW